MSEKETIKEIMKDLRILFLSKKLELLMEHIEEI